MVEEKQNGMSTILTVPLTQDVPNAYDELPEIKPFMGAIPQADFIAHAKTLYTNFDQVAAHVSIAYWESSRLNKVTAGTNPFNFQADVGKWKYAQNVIYTTVFVDGMKNKRRFCVFKAWEDCASSMAVYILNRNMFVGAPGVTSGAELYDQYNKKWILGDDNAVADKGEIKGFASLYNDVVELLSGNGLEPVATPEPAPQVIYKNTTPIMTGAAVTLIQTKLCNLGFLEAKYITGNYLGHTENAVKLFQGSKGLAVDGKCGPDTLKALGV